MKFKLKHLTILIFLMLTFIPLKVKAGDVAVSTSELGNGKHKIKITYDGTANFIQGKIDLSNITIEEINTQNGWEKGEFLNSGLFHFYHDGPFQGVFTVAEIIVKVSSNVTITPVFYSDTVLTCGSDNSGHYFDKEGYVVDYAEYENSCLISEDASLKSLSISNGALSPTFNSSIYYYNVTVENSIANITLTPEVNNSKATIISNNNCNLEVGQQHCDVVVKAQSGAITTYEIIVNRKGENTSTELNINDFKVHNATLVGEFDPNIKSYNIIVDEGASSIYFTYKSANTGQTITSDQCEIDNTTTSCKLTITENNNTAEYLFKIVTSEKDSSNNEQNNNMSNDENGNNSNTGSDKSEDSTSIKNPPTGEFFNIFTIIILLGIGGTIAFYIKKYNKIHKI